LAADIETACRVSDWDQRPRRCAKPKILDRVFRRDAFSIEIIPIIVASPSKGPAVRPAPPKRWVSGSQMRRPPNCAKKRCFARERLIDNLTTPRPLDMALLARVPRRAAAGRGKW